MKKLFLIMMVLALVGSMVFAQINISGSTRAKFSYATEAGGGWYGLSKDAAFANDNSRLVLSGNKDGKAGVNMELRLIEGVDPTGSPLNLVKLQNFWAWAKPADWFKVTLGWMDIGDYLIKDSTATTAFGGDMRNSSKLDPLGGLGVFFGSMAQFYALDGNLSIGAVYTTNAPAVQSITSKGGYGMLAVAYKIPNIGSLVVDYQMNLTDIDVTKTIRASATFQYKSAPADLAVGLKFNAIKVGGKDGDNIYATIKDTESVGNFNVMLLAGIRPIKNLSIDIGLEGYFLNGGGLADTISVSYDLGFIKPLVYMYGFTAFDTTKMVSKKGNLPSSGTVQFANVLGLELNIPIKVGTGSVLAAGVAYDFGVESFQVPVFFRLFF